MIGKVEDADHSHIADEIDMSDLGSCNIEASALTEIGDQLITLLGTDFGDIIVGDEFGAYVFEAKFLFGNPNGYKEEGIGGKSLTDREILREAIDDGEGDDNKEVGHLTYGHLLGAIANDAEDGKETESEAHLNLEGAEEVDHQEDGYGDNDEDKEVVATTATGVVEETRESKNDDEVEEKTEDHIEGPTNGASLAGIHQFRKIIHFYQFTISK